MSVTSSDVGGGGGEWETGSRDENEWQGGRGGCGGGGGVKARR